MTLLRVNSQARLLGTRFASFDVMILITTCCSLLLAQDPAPSPKPTPREVPSPASVVPGKKVLGSPVYDASKRKTKVALRLSNLIFDADGKKLIAAKIRPKRVVPLERLVWSKKASRYELAASTQKKPRAGATEFDPAKHADLERLIGCSVMAKDGPSGRIHDLLLDRKTFRIEAALVFVPTGTPGLRKVEWTLVRASTMKRADACVARIAMEREAILRLPAYLEKRKQEGPDGDPDDKKRK